VFSLVQFIEGFVAQILQLPIVYIRSNYFVLSQGVRGAYELDRLARRSNKQFLSLRAIAVLNVILIFSAGKVLNDRSGDKLNAFVINIFKPDGLLDPFFSRTLATIILLYSFYYGVISLIGRPKVSRVIFASTALYFGSLSLLINSMIMIMGLLIDAPFRLEQAVVRLSILSVYAYAFLQVGAALNSRVPKPSSCGLPQLARIVMTGAACFGVYLVSLRLCLVSFFKELVWPSLGV